MSERYHLRLFWAGGDRSTIAEGFSQGAEDIPAAAVRLYNEARGYQGADRRRYALPERYGAGVIGCQFSVRRGDETALDPQVIIHWEFRASEGGGDGGE